MEIEIYNKAIQLQNEINELNKRIARNKDEIKIIKSLAPINRFGYNIKIFDKQIQISLSSVELLQIKEKELTRNENLLYKVAIDFKNL